MNKKITTLVLFALMLAVLTYFPAFAAMPNGSVVVGNKAFDLNYANDQVHAEEITNAIVSGGAVYVKDFGGTWIDNTTGKAIKVEVIPAVVYKNTDGEIKFDAVDKDDVVRLAADISVKNATTVTFNSDYAPSSVTWNGEIGTVDSYDIATKLTTIIVPSITKTDNSLVVNASSYKTETVNYKIPVGIYDNLKVLESSAELTAAIKTQADGQTWLIQAGTYDLPNDTNTLRDDNGKVVVSGGQSGWCMPIAANNVTIIGENNPTLISSTNIANGAWASQNFITVFGDNVKISGVTLKTKDEANKVIEVIGDKFLLDTVTITPSIYKFAGSIYFSNAGKTATISNTVLNYGRISGLTGATGATINLNNVDVNFAGATDNDPKDNNAEKIYWPYYRYNASQTAAKVNATNLKVTMSNAMGSDLQDAINMLPSGTTVELSPGTYYVSAPLVAPEKVKIDSTKANIELMAQDAVVVTNVAEFNSAINGQATTIYMEAGNYKFDSQIRIDKAINIIGDGDATVITKGEDAWINTTDSKGYASIFTINSGKNIVNLESLKVVGARNITMTNGVTDYGSGVNVVNSSNVNLKNITSINNSAAGLIVNSSTVIADNLNTNGNGWYGVNVDSSNLGAEAPATSFTLNSGIISEVKQIVSDKGNVEIKAPNYEVYIKGILQIGVRPLG